MSPEIERSGRSAPASSPLSMTVTRVSYAATLVRGFSRSNKRFARFPTCTVPMSRSRRSASALASVAARNICTGVSPAAKSSCISSQPLSPAGWYTAARSCVGAEQQTPRLRQVPRRLFDSNTSGGHLLLEAGLRPGFGLRDDLRERLPGLLVKPLSLRGGIPADEAGGQNECESRIGEELRIEQVGVA